VNIDRATLSAIGLGLFLNVAAGIFSFYLTKDATATFVTLAVTELVLILELIRRLLTRPHVPGVAKYRAAAPVGGELVEIVSSVSTEFVFWGISAKTVIHNDDFRRVLIEKARSAPFRFLILSPDSAHVALRAAEEGDTAMGWKREIEANIDRLQVLRNQYGLNLEIGLFDSAPVFRLILLNSNLLYLGWYPRSSQGFHSPLIVASNEAYSLYVPIRASFEDAWARSTRV